MMLELMLVPIQFLIFGILTTDRNLKVCAVLLTLAFLSNDLIVLDRSLFYIEQACQDLLMLGISLNLINKVKKYTLTAICLVSVSMNMYEHFSYYQTVIYPYRDIIQRWMVEIMFCVLICKTPWRIPCLKRQRT